MRSAAISGFPHGKCNLYGFGTGVSLAISGPGVVGGRVVDDFVNLRVDQG